MRGTCRRLGVSTAAKLLLLITFIGCSSQATVSAVPDTATGIDSAAVVEDLRFLSDPRLRGRAMGTPGNREARDYIAAEFVAAGLTPFEQGFVRPFASGSRQGANVVGFVRGSDFPSRYIVVTAHFDHLGERDGEIFPGADDNASGTAGLIELARQLTSDTVRPLHSVIFAAFDGEETGLLGARSFVANPPVPLDSVLLNVNLDMISRNENDELYAAGAFHYPFLAPMLNEVKVRSRVTLLLGHDRSGVPGEEDWTSASDHGAFHDAGIPFAYFGVEDHADYHSPTDTFENTDPGFYVAALETILDFLRVADGADW